MDETDERDLIPTDPDGAWCYLLARALWMEMLETGRLPEASVN